ISRRQEAAIAALLSEPTVQLAADRAGVPYSTLKNWLTRPDFARAFAAARRQVVDAAVGRLSKLTSAAVETLRRNLRSEKSTEQIRAATAIMDFALRGLEVADLAQQVAELQEQVEAMRHVARGTETTGQANPLGTELRDVPEGSIAGGPADD